MRSHGGSGYKIAAMAPDGSIMGVVLIGPASSMAAERAIINPPYRVWCIKRLVCLDDSSVLESQLLRTAMRYIANQRREVLPFVAYADPAACDERTGQPLFGALYKSANFMHIGTTAQRRYSVVDDRGRAVSTRKGAITLTRKTLPVGWQIIPLPPAHVWLAIVTPDNISIGNQTLATSQPWRKRAWRAAWRALHPHRRVAAQQWVNDVEWRRLVAAGQQALAEPHKRTPYQRLQPALWRGEQLHRTAGPAWPVIVWQQQLIDEDEQERTLGRQYLPLILANNGR